MARRGIEARTRHLVSLAVNVAQGNEKESRRLLNTALGSQINLEEADEIMLMTALFAGVPRCLNGLRWVTDSLGRLSPEARKDQLAVAREAREAEVEHPEIAGARTFAAVYGEAAETVREAIAERHSFFETWVVECAYGRILSRPGLDLKTRELCAVAVLTVLELPVQLWGHMKGALNAGAKPGEVEAVISLVSLYCDSIEEAMAMCHRLTPSV